MAKKVHIIINPAAGQPDQILNKLNSVFYPAGIEWDISLTKESGDATRFARQAIVDGAEVIGAYGGDGTVMEVAQAVKGGNVPLAILPGGTANLMSLELGVPRELSEAAKVMTDPESVIRRIDMGQAGDKQFMLRVGIGFGAEKVILADRELKDKWGILAYTIAGLKALETVPVANYRITIDGTEHETSGKSCLIDNAGSLGVEDVSASKDISVDDGLLDVIVVRDDSLGSLMAVGDMILDLGEHPDRVQHWQGKEITIVCDPPQPTQGDGEVWGPTPVSAKVLPAALPVLTRPSWQRRGIEGQKKSDETNLQGRIAAYRKAKPTEFYAILLLLGLLGLATADFLKRRLGSAEPNSS